MSSITFPNTFDNDTNLFAVQDALKLILSNDYYPGQKILYVEGDKRTFNNFPVAGIVTLTDQVSDSDQRSISFFYGSKGNMMFMGLELLSGQKDYFKPKVETVVTQNVMAIHRTVLKESILSIEKYLGTIGTVDPEPFGETIMGRLNYLRKIILSPRAWFVASNDTSMAPAVITFTAEGATKDGGVITYEWDFGDGTTQTTYDPIVEKTYENPGYYGVTLKITNNFGSDTVNFPEMITVKSQSPGKAIIEFVPGEGQLLSEGVLRTTINQFVTIQVKEGKEGNRSFTGELLNQAGKTLDPIINYTWNISDDLSHQNNHKTKAIFSVGGSYDLNLRADTEYGSYRVTSLENCIDVVEDTNLWLWNFFTPGVVRTNEFGLLCETFKTKPTTGLSIKMNHSFLTDKAAIKEFKRNNGFVKRNGSSGQSGTCLLCWATGRSPSDPPASEKIELAEYNGFTDTYINHPSIARPWNWAVLPGNESLYFVFGDSEKAKPTNHSPTKQLKTTVNLKDMVVTNEALTFGHYKSNAHELAENAVTYNAEGEPAQGHFSIYRTAWKETTGYILRNKPGEFIDLKSFYKTEGTIGDPFRVIRKLPDMTGMPKSEGQLVSLGEGIFFFDNNGVVAAYRENTRTWGMTDANATITSFRMLQDRKIAGYDSESNTLLAVSDGHTKAYLSFDYSSHAFVKFNAIDLTFHTLGHRPAGEQWLVGVW